MITDLLKAGFPCVLLQTLEPHRTEDELAKITGWQIARWDCLQGIHGLAPQTFKHEDLITPIEALQWLKSTKDTVLIAHGMSNFLDDPMVSQAILNAVPVDVIYSPITTWGSKSWNSLAKYASAQGTPIVIPQEGDSFPLGNGTVTILHCWPEAWAENDMSIVLRLDYGTTSFLFTGDAEEMSEAIMLTDGVSLPADVLKVAHHGSRYSSTPEFIEAVAPSWAVISCGDGNAYGHPHEETLRTLSITKVLRTDQLGTIVFHSDGQTLTVSTADVPEVTATYIGNRNSMKFHYPDCASVADMAEHNKVPLASREDAIALGYKPCGSCKP